MNLEGRASFCVKGTKEAHAHGSSQPLMSCNGVALTQTVVVSLGQVSQWTLHGHWRGLYPKLEGIEGQNFGLAQHFSPGP